jgi:hypothetical protein
MKELFKYLRTQLKQIPGIAWVDLDKGQVSKFNMRPAIAFPAALIKIDYPRTETMNKKKQKCAVRIIIKLVWDYEGNTDSVTEDQELEQSLAYFNLCDAVYDKLQDSIDTNIFNKRLDRVSQIEEVRNDGLKVVNMVFETVVFVGV